MPIHPPAAGMAIDLGGAISNVQALAVAALAVVILFVLIAAVLKSRKGNPSQTWSITLAALIPIVVLGGAFGVGVLVFGQQIATALHLG